MDGRIENATAYRTDEGTYLIIAIIGGPLFAGGLVAAIRSNDWALCLIPIALVAPFVAAAAWVRLEIGSNGVRYRGVFRWWFVRYEDIDHAEFGTEQASSAAAGIAPFLFVLSDESEESLNLKPFPLHAAARLLVALEHQGIGVDVSDGRPVQRMWNAFQAAREKEDLDAPSSE
jgi:hypothetical protein